MHCEAQAELVIKQNNALLDSFPRIYLCPFWIWMGNRIWKKILWRRFLLQVMSWKTGGSWIQKVNVARFVKAKYIVVCSNIRCQIYFCKKLFICSFNRICFLFSTFLTCLVEKVEDTTKKWKQTSLSELSSDKSDQVQEVIYLLLQTNLLFFLNLFVIYIWNIFLKYI